MKMVKESVFEDRSICYVIQITEKKKNTEQNYRCVSS